ncbi:hypothetical protein [Pseudomonas sp. nanlin1]|uniref:hypothetical protein n=1 Tax=Pseudomonas sp. nanlin1 TaxID=3040605 RepID=UPI00388EAFE2
MPDDDDSHGVEQKCQAFADCAAGFAVGLTRERFAGHEWNGDKRKMSYRGIAGMANRCVGCVMGQSHKADF